MKKLMLLTAGCTALLLGGCASSGSGLRMIGGNYYHLNSECKRYEQLTPTKIKCFDKHGNWYGNWDAMTQSQLAIYGQQQAIRQYQQAQQSAAFNQMIQQNNAAMQAQTNQTLQQVQRGMSVPAPGSYQQPNTYETYACRDATGQIIQCKRLN